MSSASFTSSRSNSQRSRHASSDISLYETALPPMSSKELVTARSRRAVRGSESSIVMGSFRGNAKAAAALGYPPEAMPGMIAQARNSSSSAHRRTGSTIKTVMRKIFTRKRRSQTDGFDEDFRFSNPAPQRLHKDPPVDGGLAFHNSIGPRHNSPLSKKFDAPVLLSDTLDRLQARPPRRRRATLPSLIFSEGDESRDALEAVIHSEPPYTQSDDDQTRRQMKRRSRSASALRGLSHSHRMSPIQWRRRSIESYVTTTAYGAASDSELSSRPPTRTTIASAPKPSTDPYIYEPVDKDTSQDGDDDDSDQSIVVPANVGTLVNAMQHEDNVSLEQRLTTLEVKLIDLEFAIARMQGGGGSNDPSPTPERSTKKPDPRTQSQSQQIPQHHHRHRRQHTSTPPSGSGASTPSSVEEGPPAAEIPTQMEADRPLSTSTIRPSTTTSTTPSHSSANYYARPPIMHHTPSMSSLNDGHGISIEQYSALVMLLRREQSARRTLESEVGSLKEDIRQLQRMATESILGSGGAGGIGTMYPIRSAESTEFLRMQAALARDASPSPVSGPTPPPKRSPLSESEEVRERAMFEEARREERWQASRRVEVGGMI